MGITEVELKQKLSEIWAHSSKRQYIVCGDVQFAMLGVYVKFGGRDRRRIKREVRKAVLRARRDKNAL